MSDDTADGIEPRPRLRPIDEWVSEHADEIKAQARQFALERFDATNWSLQQLMSWVAYREAARILEVDPKTPRPRSAWYHDKAVPPLLSAVREIGTALQSRHIQCLNRADADWFDPSNDLWRLHEFGVELFFARQDAMREWPPASMKHDEPTVGSNQPVPSEAVAPSAHDESVSGQPQKALAANEKQNRKHPPPLLTGPPPDKAEAAKKIIREGVREGKFTIRQLLSGARGGGYKQERVAELLGMKSRSQAMKVVREVAANEDD